MKILIIYSSNNHRDLMSSLVYHLNQNQVFATACDLNYFQIDGQTKVGLPLLNKCLFLLCRIPKVRGLLLKLKLFYLKKISDSFDIVDIHFFSPIYADFIRQVSLKKNVIVTYWGADILEATKENISIQAQLLGCLKLIRANSDNVKEAIINSFIIDSSKVMVNRFGIAKFNIIESQSKSKQHKSFLLNQIKEDRILICLGYNGGDIQQHEIMINAISNLDVQVKSRIQLIVPFTYGFSNFYKSKILSLLYTIKVDFIFMDNFLTEEESIDVILKTDILLVIQKTDAFSATVQEHLFAENIVLAGSWLPYFSLNSEGVFILKTDLEDLTSNINNMIQNFSTLKVETIGNQQKMKNLSSWESQIEGWIESYNLALKK